MSMLNCTFDRRQLVRSLSVLELVICLCFGPAILFRARWSLVAQKQTNTCTFLWVSVQSNMAWDGNLFMSNDMYDYMIALNMIATNRFSMRQNHSMTISHFS